MPFQAYPAPDQIIDKGLKAGPYGQKKPVDEKVADVSMETLRDKPHGVDLGPLQPGIIDRISVPGNAIDLAPEIIVADIARLSEAFSDSNEDELLLIGRRHVRSNNSWMHNFHRLTKGKPRWQLLMHPDDLEKLKIENNSQVVIESRVGKVETTVLASDEVMQGVVSLPHGWGHQRKGIRMANAAKQEGVSCNDITDNKLVDVLSGNAALNGVPVTVSAA